MEFSYIIATVLIENDAKEVLMLNSKKIGAWSLPGGKVELGEQPRVAAARETLEETGLTIEIINLAGYREFYWSSDAAYWTELIFRAKIIAGSPTIMEPEKITALEWRNASDLPGDVRIIG